MRGRQINFYATIADIHALGGQLPIGSVKFARRDVPQGSSPIIFRDFPELQQLETYLVVPDANKIAVSKIDMEDGKTRFEVDIELNPGSAILHVGGLIAPNKLLPGQFGTGHKDQDSVATYKLVSEVIRRHFEKIKSYYVGPEAIQFLDGGGRLSPTEKSPIPYDLVR